MNIHNPDGSINVEKYRILTKQYLIKNAGSKKAATDALIRSGIYDKGTRKLSTYYTNKQG